MQGWTYAHGLATLVNIDYYPEIDEKEIYDLFIYTGRRYISGFQAVLNAFEKNGPGIAMNQDTAE